MNKNGGALGEPSERREFAKFILDHGLQLPLNVQAGLGDSGPMDRLVDLLTKAN